MAQNDDVIPFSRFRAAVARPRGIKRVEALLAPGRPSHWGFAAVAVSLAIIAIATIVEASRDLEGLFETAKHVWPF